MGVQNSRAMHEKAVENVSTNKEKMKRNAERKETEYARGEKD